MYQLIKFAILISIAILIAAKVVGAFKSDEKPTYAYLIANVISGLTALILTPIITNALSHIRLSVIMSLIPADITNNTVLTDMLFAFVFSFLCLLIYFILYAIIHTVAKKIAANSVKSGEKHNNVKKNKHEKSKKNTADDDETDDDGETDDDDDDDDAPNVWDHLSIALISVVSLLFSLFMILSPIYSCFISLSADAALFLTAETKNEALSGVIDNANANIEKYTTAARLNKIGSKRNSLNSFVYDKISSFKVNGQTTALHSEIYALCCIFNDAAPLIPETESEEDYVMDEENVNLVKDAKEKLFETTFVKAALIEVLHDSCTAWYNKETYLSINDPFSDSEYKASARLVYKQLRDVTEEDLSDYLDGTIELIEITE